jgi:hypothetical protein
VILSQLTRWSLILSVREFQIDYDLKDFEEIHAKDLEQFAKHAKRSTVNMEE